MTPDTLDPDEQRSFRELDGLRRNLSAGMCPCPECTADDGAQTTELDPEDYQ